MLMTSLFPYPAFDFLSKKMASTTIANTGAINILNIPKPIIPPLSQSRGHNGSGGNDIQVFSCFHATSLHKFQS
jgi:hypothetical protein